jgi:AbrB family looped-hinge helix DNA binding protein
MPITLKGQVTIPISIREKLGFLPNSEVEFEIEGDTLRLRKVDAGQGRGSRLVSQLRCKAMAGMSTEEIMALTRGE